MELRFSFGQDRASAAAAPSPGGGMLNLGLPNRVFAGGGVERWTLTGEGEFSRSGDLCLWRSPERVCGVAAVAVDDDSMEALTAQLYEQILTNTEAYTLHRFWNFVPQINATVGELDRYMCFCAGRAAAFGNHAAGVPDHTLPPASAVGTGGGHLCVAFVAGREALKPVENPLQVPAYRYPRRYGPRAPSFARAGVLGGGDELLISGTASIRASESLHAGDAEAQLETTLENLGAVSSEAGHPGFLDRCGAYRTTMRIYLKNAAVWTAHEAWLQAHLLCHAQQFNVVEADICRPELLVEVEAFASRKS